MYQRVQDLRRIQLEDQIYREQKRQKDMVQVQVKLMREQLALKKQQMIDELRDLRKEYKMQ